MKLYHIPQDSPVSRLLEKIEEVCKNKGLQFSRWQANKGHYKTSITYAIHEGERQAQFRFQPSVKAYTRLSQREGSTERCEAFRKLSNLLEELNEIQ